MVRVFDCHSFKSKKVIPIQDEPLAISTDEKHVFVATRRCAVIVFEVHTDGFKEIRRFETVSLVEKLFYNTPRNYLIAVEFKKSWKNLTKYVRVYLNWDLDVLHGNKIKTKVRIAGKSHSSLIGSSQNYLDVVEIPVEKNIAEIAVCSQTGNFAVAIDREVKVYHLVDKTVPSSGKSYRDVEIFLELCWNFRVVTLALCEDHIVCAGQSEFQAVRLEYTDFEVESPKQARQRSERRRSDDKGSSSHVYHTTPSPGSSYRASSRLSSLADVDEVFQVESPISEHKDLIEYSSVGQARPADSISYVSSSDLSNSVHSMSSNITDDEYFQAWRFDGEDSETGEITIHLQGLQGTSRSLGQKLSPPVLRDLRGGPYKSSGSVKAVMLLQFCDTDMREDWTQVELIPAYCLGVCRKLNEGASSSCPVMSTQYRNLASMSCMVSGGRGGCLYSLYPRIKLVTCCRYTTPSVKILPNGGLLYVATRTGIETYTSRDTTLALHQVEDYDFITKASPPTDLEICLIGVQPFIGASDVSMTTDHLILLTKVEDTHSDEVVWSLYALQTCSTVELYTDMVSFACKVMETGPASYIHLIQEAHLFVKRQVTFSTSVDPLVEDHLLESCALMGEFYSLPDEEDWRLCLPYYVMSNLSLDDIIRQAVQHKQHSKQGSNFIYGKGLLYYLNHVLFLHEDPVEVKQATGDRLLDIYMETEPERLCHLILTSRLQTFTPEKALDLLKQWIADTHQREESTSDFDLLALAKISLTLVEPDAGQRALAAVDEQKLILICSAYPSLLHKDYTEFTPLAQLMRQHRPNTFLQLLVTLVDKRVLTLDTCLKLLQGRSGEEMYTNSHIKEYLEILVNDPKRKYIFEEAVGMLSDIYIKRILSNIRPLFKHLQIPPQFQLPSGKGHFAGRFVWLDFLPPFSGPKSMTRPCQHMTRPGQSLQRSKSASIPVKMAAGLNLDRSTSMSIPGKTKGQSEPGAEKCPCCFCNEDLVKLQSLLCWENTSPELCQQVCQEIRSQPAMTGGDSLWLLCTRFLDWKQAVEFVIDRYPDVLPKFSVSACGVDTEKWEHCLRCLESSLKELSSSRQADREEVYVRSYRDMLQSLAELLPPDKFLGLLPPDGSFTFMLPYITQCLQQEHAETLKSTIMEQGKTMVSSH